MSTSFIALNDYFAVAPQMAPQDVAQAVAQGFKTLVNNRPDAEGGPLQPGSQAMEAAARAAGLHYVHLPVVSGQITAEQARAMKELLDNAPRPILAFCRSGARSAHLFSLAQATD